MKNVIFISHSLGNGGAERVTSILANAFVNAGYNLSIVPLKDIYQDYPLDSRIKIVERSNFSRNPLVCFYQKCRLIASAIGGAKNNNTIISLGAGYKYIIALRLFKRFEIISSVRNDPRFLMSDPLRALEMQIVFRLSKRVIFQTEEAISHFPPAIQRKGIVILNPIDARFWKPLADEREKIIISHGRIVPQKNLHLLIEAFSIISKKHPDYKLHIYGRGEQREELIDFSSQLGLSSSVTINDYQPDICNIVWKSTAYVNSSDVEGLSNSILEAMALGVPVVCTDCPIGGAKMVIENNASGLLVPPGDIVKLAEAIEKIISDPVKANDMAMHAQQGIRERTNDEKIFSQWKTAVDS